MLMRSWSISSTVVMIFVLAWKPRWVMMRSLNSLEMSTFDCSRKPELIAPRPPVWAVPTTAVPLLSVARHSVVAHAREAVGVREVGEGDLAERAGEAVREEAGDDAVGADVVAFERAGREAVLPAGGDLRVGLELADLAEVEVDRHGGGAGAGGHGDLVRQARRRARRRRPRYRRRRSWRCPRPPRSRSRPRWCRRPRRRSIPSCPSRWSGAAGSVAMSVLWFLYCTVTS